MRKLSTGQDSTLGNWYSLCAATFGADSKPTKLIEDRIAKARNGKDEEVIAEEAQLLFLLGQMFVEEMSDKVLYSFNHKGEK